MKREEAIRRMECCRNFLANNYSDMGEPNITAFNMAIKALDQEPCEDAVSRQALIERINNAEENFKADHMESIASDDGDAFVDGVLSGVFNIREMVAQAPSVTPTQKWIPVTEDAPPIGTICLWCNKQGSVFASEITYRSKGFSYVGQHGYFCNGLENHGNIVAWQPLPKPYKAEMESEE